MENKISQSNFCMLLQFAGMLLVMFAIMQYIVSVAGFAMGCPIGWANAPLAFVAAYFLSVFFVSIPMKKTCWPTFIVMTGIVTFTIISCFFSDDSFDGNHYHQEISVYLLDGWNPWRTYCPVDNPSLWAITYPKGIEICEATIVAVTGIMETAKVFNFILVGGTSLITYCFLRKNYPTVKSTNLTIIVIVAMMNPVVVLQILNCLNDYVAYCMVLLTAICSITYCINNDRKQLIIILLLIAFAASVKALSFFYTGLTLLFVIIWFLFHHKYKSVFYLCITGILGVAIAIFVTSWHPYITNLIHHGNILYPLLGENAVDIMSNHIPQDFRGHNRLHNWFWSLLTIDWPYNYSRAGGFGPLMWFLILSSFVTTMLSIKRTKVIIYAYLAAVLSSLCFEEAWWARYIPQLWLVVPLGGIALFYIDIKWKYRTWLLCGLLLCVLLTFGKGLHRYIIPTIEIRQVRKAIYEIARPEGSVKVLNMQPSIERQFREQGIKALPVDSIPENAYVVGITEPLLNRFNACVVLDDSLPTAIREKESLHKYILKEPGK